MLTCCLKCKKKKKTKQKKQNKTKQENPEIVNSKVTKTKNGGTMLLSKCAVCNNKKSIFMKELEAKGILSSLDLKIPLSKIPLLGDILL